MRLQSLKIFCVFCLLGGVVSACSKQPLDIEKYDISTSVVKTATGALQMAGGGALGNPLIIIHLEGDGRAYISKYRVSHDPTPVTSVMLDFVANTPSSVYLARPCQFVKMDTCTTSDWTLGRYAKKHVLLMNDVVDKIKEKYNAEKIAFVGHSGGGTMAMLIAAERVKQNKNDILYIKTLAGNLDVRAFTSYHSVTPLEGLDPKIDATPYIKNIPQIHYIGKKDEVITPLLYKGYARALNSNCDSYKLLSGVTHNTGWLKYKDEIINSIPVCK